MTLAKEKMTTQKYNNNKRAAAKTATVRASDISRGRGAANFK